MIVRSFLLLFNCHLLIAANLVCADTNAAQIQTDVENFMIEYQQQLTHQYGDTDRFEYEISTLDPRLSMADCEQPLVVQVKATNPTAKVNLKVSCLKNSPWSLYVPVDIKRFRQVVVTNTPLAKATLISSSVVELREMDISKLRGTYYSALNDVLGMQTKRELIAHSLLTNNLVEPPILVKKGESVLISVKSGALLVKISGKAMMNGRLNQQIRVQNKQSKRIVDAKVIALGHVQIAL